MSIIFVFLALAFCVLSFFFCFGEGDCFPWLTFEEISFGNFYLFVYCLFLRRDFACFTFSISVAFIVEFFCNEIKKETKS